MLTQGFSRSEKGVQVRVRMSWQGFLVSSEADKEGGLLITDLVCVLGPQRLPLFFLDGSQSRGGHHGSRIREHDCLY